MTTIPPAGWYQHPTTGKKTWWDGQQWTDREKKSARLPWWVAAIIAAFTLALGISVGTAAGRTTSDELRTAKFTIQKLEREIAVFEGREERVEQREEAVALKEQELADREAELRDAEEQVAANTFPGSGVFLVNSQIVPGIYSSTGTSCYWARLSGAGGTLGEIIANDNVDGQALVTIDPSDFAFETSRCGEWTKVG